MDQTNATAEKTQAQGIPAIKNGELTRSDHMRFTNELEVLVKDAEALRLSYMKRHQARGNTALTLGLISLVIGSGGFGWFLLVQGDIVRAVGAIALAIVVPVFLNIWASQTLKNYSHTYKKTFLPRLAKTLGGLEFHPQRGIGASLLAKTGLLPAHTIYESEDCFMGRYKDIKIIFSETRLFQKNRRNIFHGIFVLLEIPSAPLEGHTILTAHAENYQKWRHSRWSKLQDISFTAQNPQTARFKALSDQPQAAQKIITETLLKELADISELYDHAPISAAFFRKKFIFIMIPYARNMFEPSNVHLPVATRQHALHCKREIEQILQIIDVLELYKNSEPETAT
jgi:hypothetical protein